MTISYDTTDFPILSSLTRYLLEHALLAAIIAHWYLPLPQDGHKSIRFDVKVRCMRPCQYFSNEREYHLLKKSTIVVATNTSNIMSMVLVTTELGECCWRNG
jgi:hypothetical protein